MSHKPASRPHRFPPLAQVHAREQLASRDPAQLQAALAEGFQEGLSKGYEQGHASGLQNGQAEARQAAQREGHAEGFAEGRREVLARIDGPLQAAESLTAHLQQLQHDYQVALRREVVELVERVARQVIRAELTLRPGQLLALVDETVSAMPPAREGVEVFLNPQDLERLIELAPERLKAWRLHADASLEGGECRVVAGGREADAGCRQRLAACMEQVSAQLGEADVGALGEPHPAEGLDAASLALSTELPTEPAEALPPAKPVARARAAKAAPDKAADPKAAKPAPARKSATKSKAQSSSEEAQP